jgi:hypothetical protein
MSERAEQFIDDINPGLKESIRQTEEYKDLYPTAREAWQRAINIRALLVVKADAAFDEVRREADDAQKMPCLTCKHMRRTETNGFRCLDEGPECHFDMLAPEGKEEER